MISIDWEYAEEVARYLPMFKRVGKKFHFRCPVCLDSKKNAYTARGWIYEYESVVRIGCFNCSYNKPISVFLKDYHPDLYRKWLMARMKAEGKTTHTPTVTDESISKFTKKLYVEELEFCQRLDTLPENHPVIKYVNGRMLPQSSHSLLWFTREWQKVANTIKPDTYKNPVQEPRLVIPIFNEQKKIESIQGRALRKNEEIRYVTIKADEKSSKIFGLERVDSSKPVFFLEGPLDSLFVENGCAITGGQLGLENVPFRDTRVWVLDNEPYHDVTTKKIENLIKQGERVVLFDDIVYNGCKDINDCIVSGVSINEINDYLQRNIVHGLTAKMRFNKWKKI